MVLSSRLTPCFTANINITKYLTIYRIQKKAESWAWIQTGGKIHGISDDAHYSPDNDWAYHK